MEKEKVNTMITNALFHIGVKALIMNEKKEILLICTGKKEPKVLRQKKKFWDFPGGKIAIDEDIKDALRREVKEELDHEIEINKLFDVAKSTFRDAKKDLFLMLIVYIRLETLRLSSRRWV